MWRATASSPIFNNTLDTVIVDGDIDDQERPEWSNPGADHFRLDTIRYAPLTAKDVGPNIPGGIPTSILSGDKVSDLIVYPIPVDNILRLKNINPNATRITLLQASGISVLKHTIIGADQEALIDVSNLSSGIYFVKLDGDHTLEVLKIIIQH